MATATTSDSTSPVMKGLKIQHFNDVRTIERMKILDKVIYPVSYTQKYYDNLIAGGFHQFSYLAFYHDILVGSVTCRLEPNSVPTDEDGDDSSKTTAAVKKVAQDDDSFKLYIMTIGVLEACRGMGIGSLLLTKVMENVAVSNIKISEVHLHLQKSSTSAMNFYKKHGFTIAEEVPKYYKELSDNDAYRMSKRIPQNTASNSSKHSKK